MANIQKKQQINKKHTKNLEKRLKTLPTHIYIRINIFSISTYHHFFQQKPSFISKYSLTLQTNRKRNPEE